MSHDTPTLYIRLRKRVVLPKNRPIVLGQVAELLTDAKREQRLKQLVLLQPTEQDGNYALVDMMLVARKVRQIMPELTLEHFGDPHVVVELEGRKTAVNFALLTFILLLLFFGSGLAIMNFHADVSMEEVHRKLFALITGEPAARPLIMQIPYSIGIGIGMIIFFNRLFRKKFNEEPNPLEVEMYMYQENVHQYVITDEYAKQQEREEE